MGEIDPLYAILIPLANHKGHQLDDVNKLSQLVYVEQSANQNTPPRHKTTKDRDKVKEPNIHNSRLLSEPNNENLIFLFTRAKIAINDWCYSAT